jgi:hypothetical protein
MKNLFKEYLEYPSKAEEKWQMVGFFQAVFLVMLLGIPLLGVAGQIRVVVSLSTSWFIVMGAMVGYPLFILFTLRYWIKLTHNLSLLMYLSSERSEQRKNAKKLSLDDVKATGDK